MIPQTSTIASHLPRAVGSRSRSAGRAGWVSIRPWPADAVVVCSFGDASANHSTAVGALNAAALRAAYQGLPLPLLFVCEDNGIGISVPTARGWIESGLLGRGRGSTYFAARRLRPSRRRRCGERRGRTWVREHRRAGVPAPAHGPADGHAGSDVESAYRLAR